MALVKHILAGKGEDVWTVSGDSTVYNALVLMAVKNVGALMVTDEDGFVGVFSERDYARKIILKGKASKDTLVREIMTLNVICVREENTVDECMALMTEKRIRHLGVCNGETLVGVVSIGDLVKSIIAEKNFEIEQLQDYIAGEGTLVLPSTRQIA